MKKEALIFLSVTLILVLSACSNSNGENNLSVTSNINTSALSTTQEENSSETAGASNTSFSPLNTPYIGPDGVKLTIDDGDYVGFSCGYISYVKAGTPRDGMPDSYVKVKNGDKLDNGLKVNSATADVQINENGYYLAESNVSFEGELTLTGTLKCDQEADPFGEKGDLHFIPDSDNDIMLPFQMNGGDEYIVGNIHDENLPEGIEEIVDDKGKETANVKATIKWITVRSAFSSTGKPDTAILVSLSKI